MSDLDSIPPTEPTQGLGGGGTATATQKRGPGRPKKVQTETAATAVSGSDLVKDLASGFEGSQQERWFWIGVTHDCPREYITLAGQNFPRVTYDWVGDNRVMRQGALVQLTRDEFEKMRDRLPRTVVRITKQAERKTVAGEEVEIPAQGHAFTIPTPEDQAERVKQGRPSGAYSYQDGDRSAAHYLYAIPARVVNEKPQRGNYEPSPLAKTGLVWPEDTQESD